MNINFEDFDKKYKSAFLKGIETNINILKNLYDEVYVDNKGLVYSLDSKVKNGRVFCKSNLHETIEIDDESLLKINAKTMVECLKGGKTKILGCYTDENDNLIFRTTTCDYTVGCFEKNKRLNIDYIKDMLSNIDYKCNLNELLEKFDNREFINIKKDKYDLILTHKLFPMINKCKEFDFYAKENEDGTFYGLFKNHIEERNKKDEVTFSIEVYYIYRFMDLN